MPKEQRTEGMKIMIEAVYSWFHRENGDTYFPESAKGFVYVEGELRFLELSEDSRDLVCLMRVRSGRRGGNCCF